MFIECAFQTLWILNQRVHVEIDAVHWVLNQRVHVEIDAVHLR